MTQYMKYNGGVIKEALNNMQSVNVCWALT